MPSENQSTPPDPKPTEGATPAPNQASAAAEIRFTGAALEERLERERKSAVTGLLTELGLADAASLKTALAELGKLKEVSGGKDPDALKGALTELDTLKKASMTEAEKEAEAKRALEARIAEEADKATKAQQAVEAAQAELRQERLSTAIMRAANAKYPDDVVGWAQRAENAELLKKAMSAEGKPDEAGIKALVEACQKARPEWFGMRSGPGSPSNAGAKPPKVNAKERIVKKIAY